MADTGRTPPLPPGVSGVSVEPLNITPSTDPPTPGGPPADTGRTPAAGFRAGRFVLLHRGDGAKWGYVTSWETWEESEVAFPIGAGFKLRDDETGREWFAHSPYEWEAART